MLNETTVQEQQTWTCFLSPCLVPHVAPLCDFHYPHRGRRIQQEKSVSTQLVHPAPASHIKSEPPEK